jgi:hypothetical protein
VKTKILTFVLSFFLLSLFMVPKYCLSVESFSVENSHSKGTNHSHTLPVPLKGKSLSSNHHPCCNLIIQNTPVYFVALNLSRFAHDAILFQSLDTIDSIYRPPELHI